VVLQVFAPQTGGDVATPPAWTAAFVVVMALGQGAAVALVHRQPMLASGLVLVCYAGQALVSGVVPPFAAWVVIWSLCDGRAGSTSVRLPSAVGVVTGVVMVVSELVRAGSGASVLLLLLTVVVSLAAVLVRSERARLDAVGRRAAAEERLRIARDLHDLVGHGLSVVSVQSSTARMALDAGDSATARSALSAVESSSRTAMAELRQMLGVLGDEAGEAPAPGVDDIRALVDNVRAGGVIVDLELADGLGAVPRATQLGAYRIVQEGLTNALKHAPGALVDVRLGVEGSRMTVCVESSGGGPAPPARGDGGSGLEGLTARVVGLGGEITSERTTDGWLLRAQLPIPQPGGPANQGGERR
jgi:signal transduction histidine kinase